MRSFQAYQTAFTAHLRHPAQHAKPAGVNAQRMRIYREIVFNNFLASVSACFPVLHDILGKRRFSKLVRQCFFSQHFGSPLFADIPKTFVDFLQTLALANLELPAFTAQLAHYEWVELALSQQVEPAPQESRAEPITNAHALSHFVVRLPVTHRLLQYDFAVQQLSKKNRHMRPIATYLLVYRTPAFQVRFMLLNAVTYQLLQQLQTHTATSQAHLHQLSQAMPQLAADTVISFGLETLYTLYQQQALIVESTTITARSTAF
ncbi:DUF2063 domain-containing protein [Methylophilus sp. 5]|uniref:HvfC family RiPP maturation protein n=1 Tax=Methylophilus sp. 5 TaxID=1112274 RepID=UPI00048CF7CD|nr:putative DNA-binding domain-containing protein [Methylophilus sp. 5]